MPIHDLGYRGWNGEKRGPWMRCLAIAASGVKLVGRNRWLKRLLIVAWLPVLYFGIGFFFIGQSLERPLDHLPDEAQAAVEDIENIVEDIGSITGEKIDIEIAKDKLNREAAAYRIESMFSRIPRVNLLAKSIRDADSDTEVRSRIWAWLLMTFFRYSQSVLILTIVGFVAPPLISQDLRSRAYLLYFSRPIGKLEYIFGKIAVPSAYILLVSTFPALVLYLFAIMMSPSIDVIWTTWDIPLRIVAATAVLIVPSTSFALMLSSLTQESRFASFAWFATWILGHGAWLAINVGESIRQQAAPTDPFVQESSMVRSWSPISIYNNLGDVQGWLFGFRDFADIWLAFAVLTFVTTVALVVLYRRVAAPLRA